MTRMKRNISLDVYFEYLYSHRDDYLTCKTEDERAFHAWRGQFRAVLEHCMGGYPTERVDLDPLVTETHDDGPYVRQRLLLRTEPAMNVPCWLLLPKDRRPGERGPAVLALHGHGNGRDDVCGLAPDEPRAANIRLHNYDYARGLAKAGFIVIAPDHRGFGERKVGYEHWGAEGHDRRDPCNVLLLKSLLFGKNLLLLNVWDAMKCVDYLVSRDDVNATRIGACGLSYGGTLTLFAAALDDRIAAAVVSCAMSTFKEYGLRLSNFCGSQTPAALLRFGELADVGCCIAPRPLMVESGTQDSGFPIEAAREGARHIGRLYRALGLADRFVGHEFEGGHVWSGAGEAFLARWL